MANRQALRDLQNRLAARLQAARTEGASVAWLAAEAGTGSYLFPLSQAGEIFGSTAVQQVPYTKEWFLGVANLRGGLYGVVALATLPGGGHDAAPQASTRRSDALPAESSFLAFNPELGVQSVLVIDRLSGLRGAEAFVRSRAPASDAPAWFGHVYIDAAGVQWQEIDLQALAQDSYFLGIAS